MSDLKKSNNTNLTDILNDNEKLENLSEILGKNDNSSNMTKKIKEF